ncbi:uncharacterized protein [Amphiura filiformis]|uniref:uncharacterized protein isoform X2 n=1 Tax=Amphiura filiformis TaxID=82378 RepID=UPI003B20E481
MSFQTGTTTMITRHTVSGVATQNGAQSRHMAPLIRAPVTRSIPMASGFKGSRILESSLKSQSKLDFTSTSNEARRREKLRAVLAMMGSNKGVRNRRSRLKQDSSASQGEADDTLSELKQHEPKSTSMLTISNLNPNKSKRSNKASITREMSVVSDSTQSSDRGRRGAILTGHLPVRSFPEVAAEEEAKKIIENSNKRKPKVKIRGGKFRVVAKLIVLLIRFGRTYILTENDAKMIRLFSAIDAAQAGDQYKIKSDLIFDVTQFKANKQYRISNDTKRILGKPPEKKTEKEITHVQVELQPLKFVKRYPVAMQRSMIQAGWYEEYTPGRVITRYGKTPAAFYLILGGSALVLEGDPNNSGREATPADRGDVFGNDAIASRTTHKLSVISKEHIHLLCLSVEDYSRIFLAGGLQNFSDVDDGSFIRSLFIFDDWPIHLLKDNPKMVKFNYYPQGTVIVEDSDRSEWIYIVKSGSCSVMKRFHQEKDKHTVPTPAKRRKKIADAQKYSKVVSHEQKLSFKLQELQRKRAKKMKGSWRQDVWGPNLLRIPLVKDPLADSKGNHDIPAETKQINIVSCSSIYDVDKQDMSPRKSEKKVDVEEVVSPAETSGEHQVVNSNEQNGKLLPYQRIKLAKGPYLTHVKASAQNEEGNPPMKQEKQTHSNEATITADKDYVARDGVTKGASGETEEHRSDEYDDYEEKQLTKPRKNKKQPAYVQIDTLEKGDIFGILDIAFGKQLSSMSLISNGVECIEISKRFYMKHAHESIAQKITDKMRPYATEDTLTKDLQEKLTWSDHRESTMKNTARQFKRYKKMLADPRLPRLGLLPDI